MSALPDSAQDPSGGADCNKQLAASVKRTRSRSRGREEGTTWITSSDPTAEPVSERRLAREPASALALQNTVDQSMVENAASCGAFGQGSVQGAPDSSIHAESQLQVATRGDPSGRCDDLSVPVRCTASPSNQLSLENGTSAAPPVGTTIGSLPLTSIASASSRALPDPQLAIADLGGRGAPEAPLQTHAAIADAGAAGVAGGVHMLVHNVQQTVHMDSDIFRAGHEYALQLTSAEVRAAYARQEAHEFRYHAQAAVADAQLQAQVSTNDAMQYADQAYRQRVYTMQCEEEQFVQSVVAQQQERDASLREEVNRWEQGQISEVAASQAREALDRQALTESVAELQRQLQNERAKFNRNLQEER